MVEAGARKNEKPDWNKFYRDALLAAQAEYPNDSIARHRAAERAANRAMHIIKAAEASSNDSQKILVDQAFLEVFGENAARKSGPLFALEFFPDRVLARGPEGKLYEVSYTVGIDGVTFGVPQAIDRGRYLANDASGPLNTAEIKAAEAASQLAISIETGMRLHCIESKVEEIRRDAGRRRELQLEECGQMLTALAAYSEALVALADVAAPAGEEDRILCSSQQAIKSGVYRGILTGCGFDEREHSNRGSAFSSTPARENIQ